MAMAILASQGNFVVVFEVTIPTQPIETVKYPTFLPCVMLPFSRCQVASPRKWLCRSLVHAGIATRGRIATCDEVTCAYVISCSEW